MNRPNVLQEKSQAFAARIVKLQKYVRSRHHEVTMSNQILRSGTSIGANISEGVFSESLQDFIHKNKIALKECNETRYWLYLLHSGEYLTHEQYNSLEDDCVELIKLLTATINTATSNLHNKKP